MKIEKLPSGYKPGKDRTVAKSLRSYEEQVLKALRNVYGSPERMIERDALAPSLASKMVDEGFLIIENQQFPTGYKSMRPVTYLKLTRKGLDKVRKVV